jgi:hypothetical protein
MKFITFLIQKLKESNLLSVHLLALKIAINPIFQKLNLNFEQ